MALTNDELDQPRRGCLGLQTWVILVGYAMQRRTLTYRELGALLEHPPHFLGQNALNPVAAWCKEHGLAPLTAVVVNQDTNEPGQGFPDDFARLGEVFDHPWHRYLPPGPEELAALDRKHPHRE